MSRLVVITEGLTGLSQELGTRWVTIGRGSNNVFQIVETTISNQHCEVLLRGDELVIRDLLSTNGTFVGGRKITEGVLRPDQMLRLGQVELRLEISAPAAATASRGKTLPPSALPSAPPEKPGAARASHRTYRVLFVDDSMAFLEMISDLFNCQTDKGWEIHTASSPDKALAILQQKLIDMVVMDINMPLLNGVQLLGIVHQSYPHLKKVVLTGAIDDTRRADCLANGAELFLVKPGTDEGWALVFNMLTSLVRWEDHDAYSGVLGEIGLTSIIQMECMEGKSSILEVRNPQTAGEIYIESGNIIHAEAGKLAGTKAFHQLMSLTTGEFRLIPFREPSQRSLLGPWETQLAEATRAHEEVQVSGDDDGTILMTRKKAAAQPSAPAPATPVAEMKAPPPKPATVPQLKMAPATPPKTAPAQSLKPAPASPPKTVPASPLKMAPATPLKTAPAASPKPAPISPPKPAPAQAAHPKTHRFAPGMNVVTLEEIVEADTTVVPTSGKNGQPPDGAKK